jgi:hypothetical protein
MARIGLCALMTALAFVVPGLAAVMDPVDVSGAWTWTQTRPDGTTITVTLTLKQDGQNVSGKFHGQGPDSDIYDGSVKDNTLTFSVDRKIENHNVTMIYSGKVDGNTVKGEVKIKVPFHNRTDQWEAKRAAN